MNRDIRTHLAVSPPGRDETARPANAPFDLDRCEVVDRPMGTHVVEPVHPVQGVDNWRRMQPSECRGIPDALDASNTYLHPTPRTLNRAQRLSGPRSPDPAGERRGRHAPAPERPSGNAAAGHEASPPTDPGPDRLDGSDPA
jgi:hypothetical protein